MKYFESFAGVGGFSLAMANRSECVGMSEIDKYASSVLRNNYPHIINYGDITKIRWSDISNFDLLVGGSPCQDFSVAGKRKGISGERSGLFYEYLRALEEKMPSTFIWENVKGVMSSNGGWDFARIITAFSEAGYSLWWQVLNAKDFGVPQNRERVFVIGTRNRSPREILFEPEAGRKSLIEITQNAPDAERVYDPEGIGRTLKGLGGGEGAKTMLIKIDDRVRRLTCVEAERLMGWPDNWTKFGLNEKGDKIELSDNQRYKMCGNGVVSNVVKELLNLHFMI